MNSNLQKLAIVTLLLLLLVLIFGLVIYWRYQNVNQSPELPASESVVTGGVESEKPAESPIVVTEEMIAELASSTVKQLREEAEERVLSTQELRFLRNPRQEAIKELSK